MYEQRCDTLVADLSHNPVLSNLQHRGSTSTPPPPSSTGSIYGGSILPRPPHSLHLVVGLMYVARHTPLAL